MHSNSKQAETLEQKDVLGLSEINDTFDMPITGNKEYFPTGGSYTYATSFFYEDEALSVIKTKQFPITWSFPDVLRGDITFANPMKIIAIKPKKLVIADSGTFLYVHDEKDRDGHAPTAVTHDSNPLLYSKTGTRFVSVDLEDFSKSKVLTTLSDDISDISYLHTTRQVGSLSLIYSATLPNEDVYLPDLAFTDEETFTYTGTVSPYAHNQGTELQVTASIYLPF